MQQGALQNALSLRDRLAKYISLEKMSSRSFLQRVILRRWKCFQRDQGSALFALREQQAADSLQLVGVVEGGHVLTASSRVALGKC